MVESEDEEPSGFEYRNAKLGECWILIGNSGNLCQQHSIYTTIQVSLTRICWTLGQVISFRFLSARLSSVPLVYFAAVPPTELF